MNITRGTVRFLNSPLGSTNFKSFFSLKREKSSRRLARYHYCSYVCLRGNVLHARYHARELQHFMWANINGYLKVSSMFFLHDIATKQQKFLQKSTVKRETSKRHLLKLIALSHNFRKCQWTRFLLILSLMWKVSRKGNS